MNLLLRLALSASVTAVGLMIPFGSLAQNSEPSALIRSVNGLVVCTYNVYRCTEAEIVFVSSGNLSAGLEQIRAAREAKLRLAEALVAQDAATVQRVRGWAEEPRAAQANYAAIAMTMGALVEQNEQLLREARTTTDSTIEADFRRAYLTLETGLKAATLGKSGSEFAQSAHAFLKSSSTESAALRGLLDLSENETKLWTINDSKVRRVAITTAELFARYGGGHIREVPAIVTLNDSGVRRQLLPAGWNQCGVSDIPFEAEKLELLLGPASLAPITVQCRRNAFDNVPIVGIFTQPSIDTDSRARSLTVYWVVQSNDCGTGIPFIGSCRDAKWPHSETIVKEMLNVARASR